MVKFSGSQSYWEKRYVKGGNSGIGSYGRLAEFKAEVLNDFVAKKGIKSIIEFGCGDGNQLTMANYSNYLGLDVSAQAIKMCVQQFADDQTKGFMLYDQECFKDPQRMLQADLTMSLDVIYHLTEDLVFETYMNNLFQASNKWVCVYSSNRETPYKGAHVRERKFTDWIEKHKPGWKLSEKIDNRYPPADGETETSFADFYFYVNEGAV